MSRSYKKPYVSSTCIGDKAGMQKWWKKEMNGSVRRSKDEIGDGMAYKKMTCYYWGPNDGKQYWDNEEAKRK